MRTKYGVTKEYGTIIESPLRMAQKRKAARMKKEAELAEKEVQEERSTMASEMKSLVLRHHKFIANYGRRWYAGGRVA